MQPMADATTDRCQRCGTRIRNQRPVCPSCGLDIAGGAAAAAAGPTSEEVLPARGIRQVAAKAGVRMCAICMTSVPETELVDFEGQQICPQCAESVQKKAARRAAGGAGGPEGDPPPPSTYAPPRPLPPDAAPASASLPGSAAAVRAKSGGAGKTIAKVILIILGVLDLAGGALFLLTGGPVERFLGAAYIFFGVSLISGFGIWLTRILMILAILAELAIGALGILSGAPAGIVAAVIMFGIAVIQGVILWLTYIAYPS
jgi:predicted RNA-binding Zn-ribbon protein involved in translation (DUF1610 family)